MDLRDQTGRQTLMNVAKFGSTLDGDTALPQRGPRVGGTSAMDGSRDESLPRRGPRFGGMSGGLRRLVASGALAIGLGVAALSPGLAFAQMDTSRVFGDT